MAESSTMSRMSLKAKVSGGRANAILQARDSEIVRQFGGSPRIFVGKMTPRNLDQGRKCQPFLESMPSPTAEGFVQKNRRVLMKIGDLGPDQKNQPSDIKPDEKHDDNSKTRIDGGVLRGVSYKGRECHPDQLPQNPRRRAADKRRTEAHVRVGHQFVKKCESRTQQNKRHDAGRQGKDITEKAYLKEALYEPVTLRRGDKRQRGKNHHRSD